MAIHRTKAQKQKTADRRLRYVQQVADAQQDIESSAVGPTASVAHTSSAATNSYRLPSAFAGKTAGSLSRGAIGAGQRHHTQLESFFPYAAHLITGDLVRTLIGIAVIGAIMVGCAAWLRVWPR